MLVEAGLPHESVGVVVDFAVLLSLLPLLLLHLTPLISFFFISSFRQLAQWVELLNPEIGRRFDPPVRSPVVVSLSKMGRFV